MSRSRLDDAVFELRAASFDLLGHLAWDDFHQRLAVELRYRPDQPRAPRGVPEGGQWIEDLGRITSPKLPASSPSSAVLVAATRCDGFSAGCQNGGTFGTSGMIRIGDKKLCWDCTIKYLGIGKMTRDEQLELIKKFDKTYQG